VVRWLLPEYGGSAIWSFWGIEYIKLLTLLHRHTGNGDYLADAGRYLDHYAANIVRYRGFPETYDTAGNMLLSPFYKSIRQTGWIVNYQQARAMIERIKA